ncbi:MAG: HAMP domain-containing sensor histidine kinase, partial [Flavobacteriales bacterium]
EHVAVHGFVQDILDRLHTAAMQQRVTLRNMVDEELIVRSDQAILGIVVHNLVANVIKHAPGAEVAVTAESVGQLFRLTVTDTGPGLQPAALQRVRDLLDGHGGADRLRSGLGYVIVADMAALLRARVQVESAAGQGTQVVVEVLLTDRS